MTDYHSYLDNDLPCCPACYSGEVVEISEFEKKQAIGFIDLYDQIAMMEVLTQQYRCEVCGYQW